MTLIPRCLNQITLLACCLLCGLGITAAWADIPVDTGTNLSIGPAVYVTPSYPGASSTRGFALPYIDAEFDNLLYSNAADLLGIYAYKSPTGNLGAAIQYDFTERLGKDDYRLRFLKEIKATPRGKLFASKTIGIITGDVNVATDLANRGQGTLAQANLWVTIPFIRKWIFSAGPGLTWADHQYMSTFFAVTPAQSALAPLSVYSTKASIADLHLNGIATYEISSRWSIGTSVYAARLRGDAENSPITLRHSQITALGWIVYKII
jgi:MipA family protein